MSPQRVGSWLPRLPGGSVDGIPHNRDFGMHPIARASVREPRLLHHAASGRVRGGGDADNALQTVLLKAEAQRCQSPFGSKAAAPPCLVQLEARLDLVRFRPISEFIEADPADSAAGGPVESRPRAEPVHAPLLQAALGEPGDAVRGEVTPAPDSWVAQEALEFHAVFCAPGPQEQPIRLYEPLRPALTHDASFVVMPNAGRQLLSEAGAHRTLKAVSCPPDVRLGMSPTPRRQDSIVRSQMSVPQTLSTLLDLPI